jgi:hypothetical protein
MTDIFLRDAVTAAIAAETDTVTVKVTDMLRWQEEQAAMGVSLVDTIMKLSEERALNSDLIIQQDAALGDANHRLMQQLRNGEDAGS